MNNRTATLIRRTKETDITVKLSLDKPVKGKIHTTIPFMDHMLELMAFHGGLGLTVTASGDTHIDDHHLVEDLGIALGTAVEKALGAKKGINRYGNFLLPMDEALSYVAIDVSGRPYLDLGVRFKPFKSGFDYELLEDFFYAFAMNARMTIHIAQKKGRSNHHIAESIFKGFGRALRQAVERTARRTAVPSTKGNL